MSMNMKKYFQSSLRIPSIMGLCSLLPLIVLSGCSGSSFSDTPPSAAIANNTQKSDALVTAPVHTTDAKLAYIFSRDIVSSSWPGIENTCNLDPTDPLYPRNCETFYVGNPVYTYTTDLVSGMVTSIGITTDLIQGNTKGAATAPSDNFLYVLSADKAGNGLVYTFSIGYLNLTAEEFKNNGLDPLKLYNALAKAGYIAGAAASAEQLVNKIIAAIEQPFLYDRLTMDNPEASQTDEIKALKAQTDTLRPKPFGDLSYTERKAIVNLNRLMLELIYPNETPKHKTASDLHVVGSPVKGPLVSTHATVAADPLGRYVYALSSMAQVYSTDKKAYLPSSTLAVYSADQNTGALTSVGVQTFDIGQLIIAPSGQFAYGSTNGSIQAYSIDRKTGLFTAIGASLGFESWVSGGDWHSFFSAPLWQAPPFQNMAADPSGKFLFVLGQTKQTYFRPQPYDPYACIIQDTNSNGSLIYTFIIDQNTGLLTQAGPALDMTPNTMTWGSVDPFGRFIQLLNTHELDPKFDKCGYGVNALTPGYIHSFYVDQNSGKLYPSGTLAAGGREIPTDFVNAGMDSEILNGDTTGRFLYLLNKKDLYVYEVDQVDGALTAIGSPFTGATETGVPGFTPDPDIVVWPNVCYLPDMSCSAVFDYRLHSMTWAGY